MYVSIDKRMAFESNCPVKAFVICQPLGKFDIFTFLVSDRLCSIVFFFSVDGGNQSFGFLVGNTKVEGGGGGIKEGGGKLGWNYGTDVNRSK